MSVVIDSNVLVDHLRGLPSAVGFLEEIRTGVGLRASIVSRAELRAGIGGGTTDTDRLVEQVAWEPVTLEIADRAGAFAREFGSRFPGVGLVDYLIAATADVLGYDLITRNVRHFPMFPALVPPY